MVAHHFGGVVSDSVNRGTSTARRMQASLYDWIVYQRRYKAGEKEKKRTSNHARSYIHFLVT